ncbi:hypothetical protein EVA_19992 [gut metagenome]|uniref:Uncharacterized protein n=1 Tax=gut metagenome TaxID=749906 RepID=J9FX06_9ZZZZ
MVIYDVGKVVSGEVVGTLVKYFVIQDVRHNAYVTADDVFDVNFFAGFYLEAYDILFACLNETLRFFFTKYQSIAHLHTGVGIVLEVLYGFALGVEFFGGIEGNVSLACIKQLLDVLAIDVTAFTLTVRTVFTSEADPFVKLDAEPLERLNDIIFSTRYETVGVGVLNAEHHVTAVLTGKEVVVEGSTYTADMQRSRGTGCEAHANFSF